MRLRDTVTRLRAPEVGAGYGNTRYDWTAAAELELPADVQPMTSDEDVVDQQRATTRWKLWLDADAELLATDRIRWDGDIYEVDGDVKPWKRRGAVHHYEAALIKVTQR